MNTLYKILIMVTVLSFANGVHAGEFTGKLVEVWTETPAYVRLDGNLSDSTCNDTEWVRVRGNETINRLIEIFKNNETITLITTDSQRVCNYEFLKQIRYVAEPEPS